MITVRQAAIEDAEHILEIYSYYVTNTAITFEYEVPAITEFQHRMENTMRRYPYLVAEKNGRIEGFAYAGSFKTRAAYDYSCELTVYVDCNIRKCGVGRALYDALEKCLRDMGIINLYACVAYPEHNDEYLTTNSADFHKYMGFEKVGEFHKCGYKFGRWYDMIWMEKIIAEHTDKPEPLRCFDDMQ